MQIIKMSVLKTSCQYEQVVCKVRGNSRDSGNSRVPQKERFVILHSVAELRVRDTVRIETAFLT